MEAANVVIRAASQSTWKPYGDMGTLHTPSNVYSIKNQGLGKDDATLGLLLGWRYTPIIVSVFFSQAVVMILDDVKRTGPFARLARSVSTDPRYTSHHRRVGLL
jgi:hypothetical protein